MRVYMSFKKDHKENSLGHTFELNKIDPNDVWKRIELLIAQIIAEDRS